MAKCQLLLIGVLALLVGDAAAGLASGLAGGLALTAAAVLGALAQGTSLKSLDSFHNSYLQSVDLVSDGHQLSHGIDNSLIIDKSVAYNPGKVKVLPSLPHR